MLGEESDEVGLARHPHLGQMGVKGLLELGGVHLLVKGDEFLYVRREDVVAVTLAEPGERVEAGLGGADGVLDAGDAFAVLKLEECELGEFAGGGEDVLDPEDLLGPEGDADGVVAVGDCEVGAFGDARGGERAEDGASLTENRDMALRHLVLCVVFFACWGSS